MMMSLLEKRHVNKHFVACTVKAIEHSPKGSLIIGNIHLTSTSKTVKVSHFGQRQTNHIIKNIDRTEIHD